MMRGLGMVDGSSVSEDKNNESMGNNLTSVLKDLNARKLISRIMITHWSIKLIPHRFC